MTFNEYQLLAARTRSKLYPADSTTALAVNAMGLCGEAGEVAEMIKKYVGHGHRLDQEKVSKELGDILWYVAEMATRIGVPLEGVASLNIQKLKERYPEGFSTELSINRSE